MFRRGHCAVASLLAPKREVGTARPRPRFKPVNNVRLVGVVHDVQQGFLLEDAVTQFTLSVSHPNIAGAPAPHAPRPKKAASSLGGQVAEADHYTVRCVGAPTAQQVKASLTEGCVAAVQGEFKLNPLQEQGKFCYFPFVRVARDAGSVEVLSDRKRQAEVAASAAADAASK